MRLKIKELREELQLTQKELADKISNVQRNVSNWENGTSEPDCDTILKLAEVFHVSIDELFGKSDRESWAQEEPFTKEQLALLRLIRNLSDEQANAVKKLLLSFMEQSL